MPTVGFTLQLGHRLEVPIAKSDSGGLEAILDGNPVGNYSEGDPTGEIEVGIIEDPGTLRVPREWLQSRPLGLAVEALGETQQGSKRRVPYSPHRELSHRGDLRVYITLD